MLFDRKIIISQLNLINSTVFGRTRAPLRPINDQTRAIIDKELDSWLEQKIIQPVEPGEAKFVSPISTWTSTGHS
jgi:hypothetical protein